VGRGATPERARISLSRDALVALAVDAARVTPPLDVDFAVAPLVVGLVAVALAAPPLLVALVARRWRFDFGIGTARSSCWIRSDDATSVRPRPRSSTVIRCHRLVAIAPVSDILPSMTNAIGK
jgi:hypothetical protein